MFDLRTSNGIQGSEVVLTTPSSALVLQALAEACQSSDHRVRERAVGNLGLYEEQARPYAKQIAALLLDSDPGVRRIADIALQKTGCWAVDLISYFNAAISHASREPLSLILKNLQTVAGCTILQTLAHTERVQLCNLLMAGLAERTYSIPYYSLVIISSFPQELLISRRADLAQKLEPLYRSTDLDERCWAYRVGALYGVIERPSLSTTEELSHYFSREQEPNKRERVILSSVMEDTIGLLPDDDDDHIAGVLFSGAQSSSDEWELLNSALSDGVQQGSIKALAGIELLTSCRNIRKVDQASLEKIRLLLGKGDVTTRHAMLCFISGRPLIARELISEVATALSGTEPEIQRIACQCALVLGKRADTMHSKLRELASEQADERVRTVAFRALQQVQDAED